MIAGSAAISMAENAVNQVIENKGFNDFDVGDMLIDGAIGGISGAIGGPGNGSKHLTNLGKQTVKRTFNAFKHKGIKAGFSELGEAFIYYGKNTAKYYKKHYVDWKHVVNNVFDSFFYSLSTDYMKEQLVRTFGG